VFGYQLKENGGVDNQPIFHSWKLPKGAPERVTPTWHRACCESQLAGDARSIACPQGQCRSQTEVDRKTGQTRLKAWSIIRQQTSLHLFRPTIFAAISCISYANQATRANTLPFRPKLWFLGRVNLDLNTDSSPKPQSFCFRLQIIQAFQSYYSELLRISLSANPSFAAKLQWQATESPLPRRGRRCSELRIMPMRNPFARRPGAPVIQDENSRPGSATGEVESVHPGFERVDTVGSKASSALSIRSRRSQDTGEYKMSGTQRVTPPPIPAKIPIAIALDIVRRRHIIGQEDSPGLHSPQWSMTVASIYRFDNYERSPKWEEHGGLTKHHSRPLLRRKQPGPGDICRGPQATPGAVPVRLSTSPSRESRSIRIGDHL